MRHGFNGGYALDVEGTDNNMNEDGLVFAQGANKCSWTYDLYPRAAIMY
jgi:hypothetical protein